MSKNFNTHQQCVRRPESGTWQSVAMETSSNERPSSGTHYETTSGLGSSR
ncbi:unnamed protein product, partial [Staurois parvus]